MSGEDDPFERLDDEYRDREGDPFAALGDGASDRNEGPDGGADGRDGERADDSAAGSAAESERDSRAATGDPQADVDAGTSDPLADAGPETGDPLADADAPSGDPFETDAGGAASAFEDAGVTGVDPDGVWDRLTEAAAAEAGAHRGDEVATVSKSEYCETCPHFSSPPDVACGHEGTEILEFPDMEAVTVVDCPVVAERRQLEDD